MILARNILVIFVLTTFVSCLDKIDFERPKSDLRELVIQGVLTKGKPNIVQVAITTIFDDQGLVAPKQVSVNEVNLLNDKGQSILLKEVDLGKYELKIFDNDPDFIIDFQSTYKIFVKTYAGEEYESSFEAMIPVPKMKSLKVKKITKHIAIGKSEVKEDVLFTKFNISTSLRALGQTQKANLRWTFLETYKFTDLSVDLKTCYLTERPNLVKLELLNGEESPIDELNELEIFETKVNSRFSEGYYLTVIQQSISQSAFDYWNQLKEITGKTGSMFEAPPGQISTNIKTVNDSKRAVVGFFYATQTDTLRLYVPPEDVGNERRFCPPQKPVTHPLCTDCLIHPRSTLTKPDFWIE